MNADGPVYEKYRIERKDGQSAYGEKHHGCVYFVLDLDHDPFTWPALGAYAMACTKTFPKLAADLRAMMENKLKRVQEIQCDPTRPTQTRVEAGNMVAQLLSMLSTLPLPGARGERG